MFSGAIVNPKYQTQNTIPHGDLKSLHNKSEKQYQDYLFGTHDCFSTEHLGLILIVWFRHFDEYSRYQSTFDGYGGQRLQRDHHPTRLTLRRKLGSVTYGTLRGYAKQ